jgi:hypothetical protein
MNSTHAIFSFARVLLLAALAGLIVAACGKTGEGGHQRGLFAGYVQDKSEEEVTGKVGKPDAVDSANPNTPKWIYKRKTFDPDNQNQIDNETILIFQKDPASGKFKVSQVIFS